jgi:ubiquinone/menaquinone biosynthesis C-methylase UbiE
MPEKASRFASEYYTDGEASRYSYCQKTRDIQFDLAMACICLMKPALTSKRSLLLDVGSGSSLCGSVVSDHGMEWIGADVSRSMLQEALMNPLTRSTSEGRVIEVDCFLKLPFRDDMFDSIISVSAIQWVCVSKTPRVTADGFMREMYRCMKFGTFCVAQCYPSVDGDVDLLTNAAWQAGFIGNMYTCFPHASKAKKKFLCLYKPHGLGRILDTGHSAAPCVLSWPYKNPCIVSWLQTMSRTAHCDCSSYYDDINNRMYREHVEYSTHAVRLLRRAGHAGLHLAHQPACDTINIDASVTVYVCHSTEMSPCGAPFTCHVWGQDTDQNVVDMLLTQYIGMMDPRSCSLESSYQASEDIIRYKNISWIDKLRSSSNETPFSKYFKLNVCLDTESCTTALLTCPKKPPIFVVAFDSNHLNESNQISTLHLGIRKVLKDNAGSIIGIDICHTSVALLMYIPCITQSIASRNICSDGETNDDFMKKISMILIGSS